MYSCRTPTKPTTQWRAKVGVIGSTVGTYQSMETETAKVVSATDDANVVPGCTDGLVDGMASSVLSLVTSLMIDMGEETNGSKAANAKGYKNKWS